MVEDVPRRSGSSGGVTRCFDGLARPRHEEGTRALAEQAQAVVRMDELEMLAPGAGVDRARLRVDPTDRWLAGVRHGTLRRLYALRSYRPIGAAPFSAERLVFVTWRQADGCRAMVHAAILDSAERNRVMSMPLTKDERRALRYLASGKSIEEVAAILNWPIQAMRWTCAHPLVTWVLDELEASTSPSGSSWARTDLSQGREMVDYLMVHARRWVGRAAGGWSRG